ncbi:MAG: hypothetical protein IPK19_32185 [Chloroflexi bacterium]|nr:hypothetical protein [Chloroflexota bacterium]
MVNELPPGTPVTGAAEKSGTDKLRRNIILGIVGLFAILIVLFIIALVLSIAGGESFAEAVRVIRDLVIIFLVLEGVLIILALAILILQVARLVNLLQTEVKPMIDSTQSTLSTVRGTVEFMSENVTQPIVRAGGFLAGLSVLLSNLFGIRRAMTRAEQKETPHAK